MPCRLRTSEQKSKQSDQSDKDMRMELEGKVDVLQKQLADMDTIRFVQEVFIFRLKFVFCNLVALPITSNK